MCVCVCVCVIAIPHSVKFSAGKYFTVEHFCILNFEGDLAINHIQPTGIKNLR